MRRGKPCIMVSNPDAAVRMKTFRSTLFLIEILFIQNCLNKREYSLQGESIPIVLLVLLSSL